MDDEKNHSKFAQGKTNPPAHQNSTRGNHNGLNAGVDNGHVLPAIDCSDAQVILGYLSQGNLLIVNSRRRNGLILCKKFHAEFAGPGAAVGSFFDEDCQKVIPIGDLSLLHPQSHEERQTAFRIRRMWIRLTQQFTDNSQPLQRAQMILNQFETYFDQEVVARVPDEAFAQLVGVLPHTVRLARRPPGKLNVRVSG
jgi:hypothetical protein